MGDRKPNNKNLISGWVWCCESHESQTTNFSDANRSAVSTSHHTSRCRLGCVGPLSKERLRAESNRIEDFEFAIVNRKNKNACGNGIVCPFDHPVLQQAQKLYRESEYRTGALPRVFARKKGAESTSPLKAQSRERDTISHDQKPPPTATQQQQQQQQSLTTKIANCFLEIQADLPQPPPLY